MRQKTYIIVRFTSAQHSRSQVGGHKLGQSDTSRVVDVFEVHFNDDGSVDLESTPRLKLIFEGNPELRHLLIAALNGGEATGEM